MVSRDAIVNVVQKFERLFGTESVPVGLRDLLESSECITSRKTMSGHVTCSAIILDPSSRVLMIHHITLDSWLFPGGHIENGDEELVLAARREAAEETGIDPQTLSTPDWIPSGVPIDIDGHLIPESPSKGEGAHMHFDFRFVFFVPAAPLIHQTGGSHATQWRSLRDAPGKIVRRIEGLSPQPARGVLEPEQIEELLQNIEKFVYRSDHGRPIGVDGRIRISYFLDILSACHDRSICEQVANIFAKHIETMVDRNSLDGLIVPKRGNVLLASEVAKRLNLQSAAVRESILFNEWMEGLVGQGSRVLLIDDVAADGEVLLDAIYGARKAGVFVEQVIVLIDRKEGDVERIFKLGGIRFRYLCQLSDAEIQDTLKIVLRSR
jgi:orotate phosphoribosyltransferase/8-oxo-dGTP pyrophosphatase MutT (NUDIX family)